MQRILWIDLARSPICPNVLILALVIHKPLIRTCGCVSLTRGVIMILLLHTIAVNKIHAVF